MAKNLIIADRHKEYVERLSRYIQEKYGNDYEIEIFHDKEALKERVQKKKCEVVLLSPDFYDNGLYLKNIKLPIVLVDEEATMPPSDKLKWSIHKYTRITTLIHYINEEYEEVEKNRPIIYTFYAPAGGVGKTTMALSAAMTYAKAGKKVLYINLEDMDSTGMFFVKQGMVPKDLLVHKSVDTYDKLLAERIKQDESSKVMYLARKKMNEQDDAFEQMTTLVERAIDQELANIVILDLSTRYDGLQEDLMRISDYVMLVGSSEMHAIYKLTQLLEATDFISKVKEKLRLIVNQAKTLNIKEDVEVAGQIDKLYVTTPLDVCEYIAQNKLLNLYGLVY